MTINRRSTLPEVIADVAAALRGAGIRAVLTGGACASLYSKGAYQSSDLDFVLQSSVTPRALDDAMAAVGYRRKGNEYVHHRSDFFVEFLPGPLAVGGDLRVEPVITRIDRRPVRALSPTDSCRDRLAGFYFWKDRQSLRAALDVARRRPVDLDRIRRWSRAGGFASEFKEFVGALRSGR